MRPSTKRQQASGMHKRALFAPGWQAPANFEIPDDARLELKRRWWNERHPTPKAKPTPKPTLVQRIVARLARLILRLALVFAWRYAPKPAAARKRTPAPKPKSAI